MQSLIVIKLPKTLDKQRFKVRVFKYAQDGHAFLNKQLNNDWSIVEPESTYPKKSGTYAYAGGQYHNIKHLDACELAFI